jgi:hypothetical protein
MTNKTKIYDAGDMLDAVSLAANDMDWMSTAISIIRKEVTRLHESAEKGELSQYSFVELRTQIDMFAFLASERHEYHANEADRLEAEFKVLGQKASA